MVQTIVLLPEGSSPEAVAAALDQYRRTVAEHNRQALTFFVHRVEEQQPPAEEGLDPEEVTSLKLDALAETYLGPAPALPEFIQTPFDLLTRFAELIPLYNLDGVVRALSSTAESEEGEGELAIDTDAHRQRERYRSIINDELEKQTSAPFDGYLTVPREFEALMASADAVIGSGLHYWQELYQTSFFSLQPWQSEDRIRERVLSKDTDRALELRLDVDWEIAAAWRTGDGPNGASYAVFCRNAEEQRPWRWRYKVANWDVAMEPLHDDLVGLLEYYAHYDAPDLGCLGQNAESVF